jgi:hypothetical protein
MTDATTYTVPKIYNFPHPKLTPIVGIPTAHTIQQLRKEVYGNAIKIPSEQSTYVHMPAIMEPDVYARLPNTVPFVPPEFPGNEPIFPNDADEAGMDRITIQHAKDKKAYDAYTAVLNVLLAQLLLAVEAKYYVELDNPIVGFALVTPRDLLAHLQTAYGTVTCKDIEANRKSLSATWNPNNAIQDIWACITYAKVYAINAGAPLSDGAIMSLTLETLTESGVFTTAIEKWDDKEEEQTWVAFQKHFNKANQTRLEQLTTKQAGYHGENEATDKKPAATPPTAKVPIPTKEPYVVMTDGMTPM